MVVHKWALVLNLLVALAICTALAVPYEWWSRHSWRFSLRTLLGLFVVAALVFGWGRWLVDNRNREQAVQREIEATGCVVEMRYWGPAWLWRLVGQEHLSLFFCIDEIDFNAAFEDRDKLFDMAATLRNLRGVRLEGGDRDLARLARLQGVTRVAIDADSENPLTPAGLTHLQALRNLRELTIHGADIGDAGLAEIGRLKRLESLDSV